jgi:hypothetical protein
VRRKNRLAKPGGFCFVEKRIAADADKSKSISGGEFA